VAEHCLNWTVVIAGLIQFHFLCRYGDGFGPIWLDDVDCSGGESCLLSCSNRGIGSHNCAHYEDVVISCSGTRFSSIDCSFSGTSKLTCVWSFGWVVYCKSIIDGHGNQHFSTYEAIIMLASFQARQGEEREPGIHCLRMHLIIKVSNHVEFCG